VIHPDYGACRNTLPGTSKARIASRAGKPLSSWPAEAAASQLQAEALAEFLAGWEPSTVR
jgi:hypothetical protein